MQPASLLLERRKLIRLIKEVDGASLREAASLDPLCPSGRRRKLATGGEQLFEERGVTFQGSSRLQKTVDAHGRTRVTSENEAGY